MSLTPDNLCKLNYPIETPEAYAFWSSNHKCNRIKAIMAFSLNICNANDNLRRYGYTRAWRQRALASFGDVKKADGVSLAYINNPEMKDGCTLSQMSTPWWECMSNNGADYELPSGCDALPPVPPPPQPLVKVPSFTNFRMASQLTSTATLNYSFEATPNKDVEVYTQYINSAGETTSNKILSANSGVSGEVNDQTFVFNKLDDNVDLKLVSRYKEFTNVSGKSNPLTILHKITPITNQKITPITTSDEVNAVLVEADCKQGSTMTVKLWKKMPDSQNWDFYQTEDYTCKDNRVRVAFDLTDKNFPYQVKASISYKDLDWYHMDTQALNIINMPVITAPTISAEEVADTRSVSGINAPMKAYRVSVSAKAKAGKAVTYKLLSGNSTTDKWSEYFSKELTVDGTGNISDSFTIQKLNRQHDVKATISYSDAAGTSVSTNHVTLAKMPDTIPQYLPEVRGTRKQSLVYRNDDIVINSIPLDLRLKLSAAYRGNTVALINIGAKPVVWLEENHTDDHYTLKYDLPNENLEVTVNDEPMHSAGEFDDTFLDGREISFKIALKRTSTVESVTLGSMSFGSIKDMMNSPLRCFEEISFATDTYRDKAMVFKTAIDNVPTTSRWASVTIPGESLEFNNLTTWNIENSAAASFPVHGITCWVPEQVGKTYLELTTGFEVVAGDSLKFELDFTKVDDKEYFFIVSEDGSTYLKVGSDGTIYKTANLTTIAGGNTLNSGYNSITVQSSNSFVAKKVGNDGHGNEGSGSVTVHAVTQLSSSNTVKKAADLRIFDTQRPTRQTIRTAIGASYDSIVIRNLDGGDTNWVSILNPKTDVRTSWVPTFSADAGKMIGYNGWVALAPSMEFKFKTLFSSDDLTGSKTILSCATDESVYFGLEGRRVKLHSSLTAVTINRRAYSDGQELNANEIDREVEVVLAGVAGTKIQNPLLGGSSSLGGLSTYFRDVIYVPMTESGTALAFCKLVSKSTNPGASVISWAPQNTAQAQYAWNLEGMSGWKMIYTYKRPTSLLTNGDFSSGFDGWFRSDTHWRMVDGRAYHPEGSAYRGFRQDVELSAGTIVGFDCEVIKGSARMFGNRSDGNGETLGGVVTSATPGVQHVEFVLEAGINRLHFATNNNVSSVFYIDNVYAYHPHTIRE